MTSTTSLAGRVRELARTRPKDIAYFVGDVSLDWSAYDAADLARSQAAMPTSDRA